MKSNNKFACAVNCMDGRVQDAVKNYLKENYGVDFVDVVTEPGPNKILEDNTNAPIIENIKKRIDISVNHHGAKIIAIAGHFGCAGNPVEKEEQVEHLRKARKTVEDFGFNAEVVILWVGEGWQKAEEVK